MQIDPTKDAQTNFMNMFTLQNPGILSTEGEFELDNIQDASDVANPAINTSVEIVAVAGQPLKNSITVTYKRITLADEVANPPGPVTIPSDKTTSDVAQIVSDYFGLINGELNWAVTTPPSRPTTTTLTLQVAGSCVYQDGTVDVTLDWQ